MKKIITFILLFSSQLWANYQVLEIKNDAIFIEKNNWPIGTSGILNHPINKKHSTILARVEVVSQGKLTELRIHPFDDLQQEALPILKVSPSLKDNVQLGWLHKRVLVIAPNQNAYQMIVNNQKNNTFIKSDLFALHLSKEGHPSPLKSDIRAFCKNYDVGVIELVIGQKLYKVDAYTLKVIDTVDVSFSSTKEHLPFFSHVQEIEADWWGEGSEIIKNYKTYYKELLGVKS